MTAVRAPAGMRSAGPAGLLLTGFSTPMRQGTSPGLVPRATISPPISAR